MAKRPKARSKKKIASGKKSAKTTRSGRKKPIPSVIQAGERIRSKAAALDRSDPVTDAILAADAEVTEAILDAPASAFHAPSAPTVDYAKVRKVRDEVNTRLTGLPSTLVLSDPPERKWYHRLAAWIRNL